MNKSEIEKVIGLIAENNGKPVPTLQQLALSDALVEQDFNGTVAVLVDLAKQMKWVSASDVLGAFSGPSSGSKFGDADAAWAAILDLAQQEGGMKALIATLDSAVWPDKAALSALWEIRRQVLTVKGSEALWAFREAYNRNAGGTRAAATVGLPAPPETGPPEIDRPTAAANLAKTRAVLAGIGNSV